MPDSEFNSENLEENFLFHNTEYLVVKGAEY